MDEDREFQDLLERRRRRAPRPLFESAFMDRIKRNAAARVRAHQAGVDAWTKIARPEWLAETEFESFEGGVFRVTVANSALAFDLRRQAQSLARLLAGQLPGVQGVQFLTVLKLPR